MFRRLQHYTILLLCFLLKVSSLGSADWAWPPPPHPLMSQRQQLDCQQSSSKSDPIGSLLVAGCPLTLRKSRGGGGGGGGGGRGSSERLLLEPAACVTPDSLREAAATAATGGSGGSGGERPLAYNPVRGQAFFWLRVQLHHQELLNAAASYCRTAVQAMRPVGVSVSASHRSRRFELDNARLVDDATAALLGVYCDRESDCRMLRQQIASEPDYFLEIIQLRLTVEMIPYCYKTIAITKGITRMTRGFEAGSMMIPRATEKPRPPEIESVTRRRVPSVDDDDGGA